MRYIIKACLLCLVVSSNLISCLGKEASRPILILGDDSNYGSYTGEILKAEGFNEFEIKTPFSRNLNIKQLNRFDIVILTEIHNVTEEFRNMLKSYIKSGGNLIAFRPDPSIASLFGLENPLGTGTEGYIKIDTSTVSGSGLTSETLQYHGTSDLYKFYNGKKIAGLYKNSSDATDFPALVIFKSGKGHTAAFTYNLPKSIVYTRQGNPDWAGEERDKVDGPTATDLYYPLKGEIQWNDPSKIAIPQADEQMRLLSHLIEEFSSYIKPLPRLWYFPDGNKCIFIFTIDGENNSESEINKEILDVQSMGGNATLYEIGTYIPPARVKEWKAKGNEVAVHYNDVPNYSDPTYANMTAVFYAMTNNFHNAYGFLPKTVRNHWVVWVSKDSSSNREFAEQAFIEAKFGIGMDCNYYQFGGNKVYPNWMGDVGHITGSGIPMKFADSHGRIINIYQSNTQLPDETWLKENIEGKSITLIDRSLNDENYAWINANYHTWYWPETRPHGLNVLDYCRNKGVPVWTAEKAYDFLKMKDEASFNNLTWSKNKLSFTLNSSLKHSNELTLMLPAYYGNLKLKTIAGNSRTMPFKIDRIKGNNYALITISPGQSYNFSADYSE